MDHTICKIVQDIASWFVGNIDNKIKAVIEKMVPPAVEKIINTEGNKILGNLVMKKRVDKWATVDFALTNPPAIHSDEFEVDLLGRFVPDNSTTPHP